MGPVTGQRTAASRVSLSLPVPVRAPAIASAHAGPGQSRRLRPGGRVAQRPPNFEVQPSQAEVPQSIKLKATLPASRVWPRPGVACHSPLRLPRTVTRGRGASLRLPAPRRGRVDPRADPEPAGSGSDSESALTRSRRRGGGAAPTRSRGARARRLGAKPAVTAAFNVVAARSRCTEPQRSDGHLRLRTRIAVGKVGFVPARTE